MMPILRLPRENLSARRCLVLLHRYTGLLLALFLILLGLTGSLLAFSTPLEHLVAPDLFADEPALAPRLDLGTLAARVQAQEPHAWLSFIAPDGPNRVEVDVTPRPDPATGQPYNLGYDDLFADPVTGQVLARRTYGQLREGLVNLMPFIFELHSALALGVLGQWVLGLVGLAWTVDCFVGFALAWPQGGWLSWRRWRMVLGVKRHAGAFRTNVDLHRAGGLWLWPILFVFAWSSVMFNLPRLYGGVTTTLIGGQMPDYDGTGLPANPSPRLDFPAAAACGARLMAQQAARDGARILHPIGLGYFESYGVYTYAVQTSEDVGARTWESNLWLDGNECVLRRDFSPRGKGAAALVSTWLNALHFADLHGWLLYRVFVALVGLAVAGLSATGLYIFWRKRRARKAGGR